ncbi:MAG: amidohydrolase family protein, partial [Candidatus Nanopelagicales bacterium]|nr:amidohydrolase family protein [Candidatus Nanopelagicales bacterium]
MTVVGWTNIGELCTADPTVGEGQLGIMRDAALVAVDGRIAWIGPAGDFPDVDIAFDLQGAAALPGFVDAHMHPVFAGDRAAEFDARMSGMAYTAGGIRATVAATRAASDEELAANAARLVTEAARQGTTTVEAKSGYGLTVADERRSLIAAGSVTDETTFLGAHVVPVEYADRPDDYVTLVAGDMLDACAPYATWADVFIEQGAFDVDQARHILEVAKARGLGLRVHANQLTQGGGVRLAVELGAASVDHCTHLGDDDIEALAGSGTVATLVPGAEFSTRSAYAPARRLWDAGVTVAIASDCNPGSSYTTSMPFVIA